MPNWYVPPPVGANFEINAWGEQQQPHPQENAQEGQLAGNYAGNDYINALFQEAQEKKMYGKTKAKVTPPSSLTSSEYRDLVNQTAKLEASIHQESEELERVLETISTQVEVVRDIGSQVRSHISSLQKAAIQLERWRLTMPQPDSLGSVTGPVGGHSALAGAGQLAQVGQVQVAPGLLLQDQE